MMTDEAREELTEEVIEEQEVVSEQPNPEVDKASRNGWCPKEDWKGDSNDWVSAKKFNERGDMIGSIRDLKHRLDTKEQEFDSRLANQHKLHEANTKAMREDLETRRRDAILEADVDKAEKIQGQIDTLNVAPPVQAPAPDNTLLNEWNTNNSWIFEESPKSAFAHRMFEKHTAQGKSLSQSIQAMEADVTQHFPEVNQRRYQPSSVENVRSNPGKKVEKKLFWTDLTAEESRMYKMMPDAWSGDKGKEAFLQAVFDERKARG